MPIISAKNKGQVFCDRVDVVLAGIRTQVSPEQVIIYQREVNMNTTQSISAATASATAPIELSATLSTASQVSSNWLPNFCILPTDHTHYYHESPPTAEEFTYFLSTKLGFNNQSLDEIKNSSLSKRLFEDDLVGDREARAPMDKPEGLNQLDKAQRPQQMGEESLLALNSNKLRNSDKPRAIQKAGNNIQSLDPYIDAVPVKTRTDQKKRGNRVKPATKLDGGGNNQSPGNKASLSSKIQAINSIKNHEPQSSHYSSKVIHVEEKGEDGHSWSVIKKKESDYESDESDFDSDYEDDHDDNHDDHHHHNKKHGKKKKVYMKKKKYPVKGKYHKRKKYHHKKSYGKKNADDDHYYHKGKGKGKKYRLKVKHKRPKSGGRSKKRKKVKYAYVYEPYDHHHHKYEHDDHHAHYYYGKGEGIGKGKKYKHMDKAKFSVAGLLGYTLLCVNYLMILQQPSYNHHHHGNLYTKYAPDHDPILHKKTGGGPVILAHCSELPAPAPSPAKWWAKRSIGQLPEVTQNKTVEVEKRTNNTIGMTVGAVATTTSATEHANYYVVRGNSQVGPPSYYYTRQPSSQGILSPIQNALNRLFLPTTASTSSNDDYLEEQLPIRVDHPNSNLNQNNQFLFTTNNRNNDVRLRHQSRRLVQNNRLIDLTQPQLNGQIRVTTTRGNGRVILVDGVSDQPEVVQTKDNLAQLRQRQVPVTVRITRRRFVGPERPVNLLDYDTDTGGVTNTNNVFGLMNAPVAVQPPMRFNGVVEVRGNNDNNNALESENSTQNNNSNNRTNENAMLADQPETGSPAANQQQSPGNNQILDLPDYALAGDSIELACNHNWPLARLYSVKWFKDSLEFYRFIPANGARAKSFLQLPGVRIDLARSNSQVLYLRNVTHWSSGLYRCEVVSEGPNFETVSGEKRMQVYALPETGPKLSLLENVELPAPTPPPPQLPLRATVTATVIGAGGAITPATLLDLNNPPTNGRQANDGNQANWSVGGNRFTSGNMNRANANINNNDDDDDDLGNNNNNNQRLRANSPLPVAGPVVRCESSRSNPVAQLRFFINNQLVPVGRTLENSTISYSDQMEANMISLQLTLEDFEMVATTATGANSNGESETGLLKAKSRGSPPVVAQAGAATGSGGSVWPTSTPPTASPTSTTTTSTTTTTTTSTTARPTQVQRVDSRDKQTGQGGANAGVHFDDQPNVDLEREKLKLKPKARGGSGNGNGGEGKETDQKRNRKLKNKQQRRPKPSDQWGEGFPDHESPVDWSAGVNGVSEEDEDERGDSGNYDKKEEESYASSSELPVKETGSDGGAANYNLTSSATMTSSPTTDNHLLTGIKAEISNTNSLTRLRRGERLAATSGGGGSNRGADYMEPLVRLEQQSIRSSIANKQQPIGANGASFSFGNMQQLARQQQQQQPRKVYSNYIRIKCISLVPAVGYEMTSELNVPLTVLVPASQLSDVTSSLNVAGRLGVGGASGLRNGNNVNLPDQPNGNSNTNNDAQLDGLANLSGWSQRTFRNGGSLQSPRAVLIDRLAQASSPKTAKGVSMAIAAPTQLPANSTTSSPPSPSNGRANNTTQSTQSHRNKAMASSKQQQQQRQRNRALEQRAKHLEELARRDKLNRASSGAESLLVHSRNLVANLLGCNPTTQISSVELLVSLWRLFLPFIVSATCFMVMTGNQHVGYTTRSSW